MAYTIRYDTRISDDLRHIGELEQKIIRRTIETKLLTQPALFGKPLRHSLTGFRCLRIGAYRIVYAIRGTSVLVVLIADRKRVYEEARKRLA